MTLGIEAAVGNEPLAERVNGAHVHLGEVEGLARAVRDVSQKLAKAFLELEGGLLREGGQEDLLGLDVVEDEEIERAPEQDAGFAGARSCR